MSAILKNSRKNTSQTFPQTRQEESGEAVKGGVTLNTIVTTRTCFTFFATFFSGILKNCRFLAALSCNSTE
jgi:hypothetical protein